MDEDQDQDFLVEDQNVTPDAEKNFEQKDEKNVERKGFNVTSLILGIIGCVLFCQWYIAIPCGIVAIIFSVAGKADAGRGMGVAGLILGIVALVLCILVYGLAIAGAITGSALANSLY